ncbi:MAG: Gfo/Idh/MocA family oxidoreductase [Clostridia bacterium]|nr:Gfo/Idh/MocA family oxidoreductase [Clostridia bacterium]
MSRNFRVTLIGCGSVSGNHLRALNNIGNNTVVALCDLKPERAEAMREKYGLNSKIYTDYIEMLDTEKPDAVHICTPHYLHCEMTLEALKRGIYVFLEKPMCINIEQMEAMLEAERNSTASVNVCFQNRFTPSIVRAREIVEADGGITSAFGSLFWERDEKYYTESGWRGSYATEGGGVMINQAIHMMDLLIQFGGKPISLRANIDNYHLRDVIEVEDCCSGYITHESGLHTTFYATTSAKGLWCTDIQFKTANHILEVNNYNLYVDKEFVDTDESSDYAGKACYGNGHEPLIDKFYKAIENGTEMPVTMESAKWAVRLLLAAYKSHGQDTEI